MHVSANPWEASTIGLLTLPRLRTTLGTVSVARSWVRGLLGVSGVMLLVPVGLVAAVVLAATISGGGVSSVSQVVDGPAIPSAQLRAGVERIDRGRSRQGGTQLPTVPI